MKNIYLDPNSYFHLNNALFDYNGGHNLNDCLAWIRFLNEYCKEKGINLNTIDIWKPETATNEDVYISFDHKRYLRKIYWQRKNKDYPIVNLKKFARKILFHFEPPVVMPEMRYGISGLARAYDKVFFTWKIKNPKISYFHTPQCRNKIFPEYWDREGRKFLTIINSNRKPISRYKELLGERLKAIIFFSKDDNIDLYGFDWDKPLFFPYSRYKGAVKKAYKGSVENKYEKLSEYKFALAYENCRLPGYITDKVFDCFMAGTVPVYLGASDIGEHIPKNSFVDRRNFKSYRELGEFLKSLSEKEIKNYKEKGRQFLESEQYKPFTKEHFAKIFVEAVLN